MSYLVFLLIKAYICFGWMTHFDHMKEEIANIQLIKETYSFYWESEECWYHPEYGLIAEEYDRFHIEVKYQHFQRRISDKTCFICLIDKWTLGREVENIAAHYERVANAFAFGLIRKNLHSKTYRFIPSASKSASIEVEIGIQDWVELKSEGGFHESCEDFCRFLEFVGQKVKELQVELRGLNKK